VCLQPDMNPLASGPERGQGAPSPKDVPFFKGPGGERKDSSDRVANSAEPYGSGASDLTTTTQRKKFAHENEREKSDEQRYRRRCETPSGTCFAKSVTVRADAGEQAPRRAIRVAAATPMPASMIAPMTRDQQRASSGSEKKFMRPVCRSDLIAFHGTLELTRSRSDKAYPRRLPTMPSMAIATGERGCRPYH